MRKKIVVLIVLVILTSLGIIIILNNKNKSYEITDDNDGQFAFYYENDNGKYEKSTDSKWDSGKYILNLKNTTCDGENNPSFLKWNNDNNSVVLTRNKATKCSLYFDIKIFDEICDDNSLACYITKKKGTSVGSNNEQLLFHNNTIDVNNDGKTDDAGDLSYRYSGDNPDNYICFGSNITPCPVENLYRILGVFPFTKEDGTIEYRVKLIKSEYITGLEMEADYVDFEEFSSTYADLIRIQNIPSDGFYLDVDGSSEWQGSSLYYYFNLNYLNNTLSEIWRNKISPVSWYTGSVTGGFAVSPKDMYIKETKLETINAEVGLIYVSDYGFASSKVNWNKKLFCSSENDENCYKGDNNRKNNWLFNSTFEWTIIKDGSTFIDINWFGDCHSHSSNQFAHHARPVFYLNADVEYLSGTGTINNPYKIVTKAIDLSGNNYNGEFIGNANIQKGDEGHQGLYFDGNESYVDIADLPETIKWNDGFSYEFEAKWLAFNNYSRIFDFGNGVDSDNIYFTNYLSTNKLYPGVHSGATGYLVREGGITDLNLNERVKIKVAYENTYKGIKETIYKNDVLISTREYETQNLILNITRKNNYLGKSNYPQDSYFNGYIYNIKFTDAKGNIILWYDFSR